MTVFLQNARSVFRVSHVTVPGPAGGGPVTAPARRLWPTSSILPVCGRCGSLGGCCPAAPLGAVATIVTATATTTDSVRRLPKRMADPPPYGYVAELHGAARLPSGTPLSSPAEPYPTAAPRAARSSQLVG